MSEARENGGGTKWAKVIDHTRCIGCHACTTACKSENEVPLAVTRTYVKYVDVGVFPQARRAFQVTRCNQCDHAPCVTACPTSAMFRRSDGIVDFDKSVCIGCKACIAACPYDAIFINPADHSAEKCNFCAHRIDMGLEPACVVVCPTEAILVGDLNDPLSKVAQIVNREAVTVRRPEKDTLPKLYYKGAHQATLDPLAARRPEGGLFLWSEQGESPFPVPARRTGSPTGSTTPAATGWTSSAAAVLSYDVPHSAPWDWRVSAYTWTKGIAAGVYIVPLALALAGLLPWDSTLWRVTTPALALVFLSITGALLIADLAHPERFLLIFTRPQWRSWLVRGGFLLLAFGATLLLHLVAGIAVATPLTRWAAIAGGPLAVLTAVYTAYLFAQAKARDLWQNPLLPIQLVVQAVLLGAASIALFYEAFELRLLAVPAIMESGIMTQIPPIAEVLAWTIAAAAALHLLLVLIETTLTHTTAHARLAAREMTRGQYALWFWFGIVLVANALVAPWAGVWVAIPALVGVFAHEHAYVQAGQSVPLA
jgi:Fe-S-cluster-containing dehydrogenase component/formate-dependent nitrite reductase membrane component NrfD